MDLDKIRDERKSWLKWKNIAPLKEIVDNLRDVECSIKLGDTIEIDAKDSFDVYESAKLFKPWRKGPFRVFDTFIDSEWQSFMKYNLIREH
ncbi:MAG: DUF1698 domain-containing protein, partial [Sulfurimonas sp.]